RHIPGRDAKPLLEALTLIPNVELTLFGEGPLLEATIRYAKSRGVNDRVRFVPSIENWRLCASLPEFDVLLVNSAYREMPKSVMEAALSGLPVVANLFPAADSPEYASIPAILVEGSPRSYAIALEQLAKNARSRNELAIRTLDAAWMQWDPATVARLSADLLIGLAR
ncbi:MAG: glycosyltransferase, partial [Gammaproteobacteria bacterium]|nr:glycosyltransferase [Gammaproteobacteria bacterium]